MRRQRSPSAIDNPSTLDSLTIARAKALAASGPCARGTQPSRSRARRRSAAGLATAAAVAAPLAQIEV